MAQITLIAPDENVDEIFEALVHGKSASNFTVQEKGSEIKKQLLDFVKRNVRNLRRHKAEENVLPTDDIIT